MNVNLKTNCERKKFRFRKKVQVGKDQEKAQSEKDSHSKNRGGKKLGMSTNAELGIRIFA